MKRIYSCLLALVLTARCFADEIVDISKHPTLGDPNSKVHVVAFLEPKCPDSKNYQLKSFPKFKSEYISNNRVSYTVVTASFLPQSMPAAMALLCVYHQDAAKPNPELFFQFLDYIYHNQPPERDNWATISKLQEFASKASKQINTDQMKQCIESGRYKQEIEENTALGNKLMGHISTPTIFVNGVKVENSDDTIDYNNLKEAIDKAFSQ